MADKAGSLLDSPLATRSKLPPQNSLVPSDQIAFAPPHDPLSGVDPERDFAGVVFRDVPITTVARWDIGRIREALDSHIIGLWQESGQLVDSLAADERVQATLGSRTAGVFGQPVRHTYTKGSPAGLKEKWLKNWSLVAPQSVMSEVIRWAVLEGFFCGQILWDTTDPEHWTQRLQPWHPQFMYYRWDTRRYMAISLDGSIDVVPGNGKWALYTPHGHYRGWIEGTVRAIAEKWLIKQYAWRDWARYNERHGIPIIKAKVPVSGNKETKAAWLSSLSQLGQESVLACPQGIEGQSYDLDLLEAKDQAWESFRGTIDRCDMAIVLPIMWQNLTTEVKEGSFAAAREHGDIRQAALRFDDATVSEWIYQQIARPWAAVNYGDPDLAPHTHWRIKPTEDIGAEAAVLEKVVNAIVNMKREGVVADYEKLARHYDVRLGSIELVAAAVANTPGPIGGAK